MAIECLQHPRTLHCHEVRAGEAPPALGQTTRRNLGSFLGAACCLACINDGTAPTSPALALPLHLRDSGAVAFISRVAKDDILTSKSERQVTYLQAGPMRARLTMAIAIAKRPYIMPGLALPPPQGIPFPEGRTPAFSLSLSCLSLILSAVFAPACHQAETVIVADSSHAVHVVITLDGLLGSWQTYRRLQKFVRCRWCPCLRFGAIASSLLRFG